MTPSPRVAFAGPLPQSVAERVRARLTVPCDVVLVDEADAPARRADVDVAVTLTFTRAMGEAAKRRLLRARPPPRRKRDRARRSWRIMPVAPRRSIAPGRAGPEARMNDRYRWPEGKRCAVALSFDFDAESSFIFREPVKARRSLAGLEERRFGARVGVDRILRLLDRLRVPATFFVPGWTAEHHRAPCEAIRDAGHEIGAHGNVHEAVDLVERPEEEAIMRDQLAILRDVLDVRPAGYRSPSWDVNLWTPEILKAHGFLYDSSLMGDDVPYDLETAQGTLIEVPVQWLLDDAPLFRHVYGSTNGIADPGRVLQMWSREFSGMHAEGACFVLTCHPFLIGRASRIDMLEELVASMRKLSGVWFATCEEIARWHTAARAGRRRRAAGTGRPNESRRIR